MRPRHLLPATLLLLACEQAANSPVSESVAAVDAPAAVPVPEAQAPAAGKVAGAGADAAVMRRGYATVAADATAPPDAGQPSAATPMLVRTGSATVEVDSLEPALEAARALATRLGGYVGGTSIQAGRTQVRVGTLELKLPADRFDEAVSGLAPLGRVEGVNVAAEDVGEEYADLDARLANGRRLEERLVALLATRTGKLDDVLAVERELARVREGIERVEGRMRYLRTRARYATLHLTLREPAPLVGTPVARNPLGDAVRQAWRNFLSVIALLIASLGVLVPLGALAAAAWLVTRRWLAPRRPSRPAPPPGAPDASEERRAA